MFLIDGKPFPFPSAVSFASETRGAARRAVDGTLLADTDTGKGRMTLTWAMLSDDDFAALKDAVTPAFYTVGIGEREIMAHRESLTAEVFRVIGNVPVWRNVRLTCREK